MAAAVPRLGVFGGSFDPPHVGHLIIASEACSSLGLERVLFVPAASPPHKDTEVHTAAEVRLTMTSIAVGDDLRFVESGLEVERGLVYTRDTLAAGTGANGRVDPLARAPQGRLVVIDLKWQRSESRRRAELKNGVALQIAVYARHVADGQAEPATGFFMLRQKRFLTNTPLSGGMATLIEGATPKETWDKIAASFGFAFDEIGKGRVRATFERTGQTLEEFSDPYLLVPPKCRFCDYADICGGNT